MAPLAILHVVFGAPRPGLADDMSMSHNMILSKLCRSRQEVVKLTFQSSATAVQFICGLWGERRPVNICTHAFYLAVGIHNI
jgi:hypothetical protein